MELGEGLGGVPLLPDVAALFECRSLYRYWGGDHVIFIGRVDRCRALAGAQAVGLPSGADEADCPPNAGDASTPPIAKLI
jgi:flavin reductase (DIM6/NTAB) family NADH-FMN oxidoreductase RutF